MCARMRARLGIRFGVWLGIAAAACSHGHGPDRAHVEALFLLDASPSRVHPAAAWSELGGALFEHRLGGAACSDCHPRAQRGQDGRVHGRDTAALADVARQALFGRDGSSASLAAVIARELAQHHGIADDAAACAALESQPELARRAAAAELPPTVQGLANAFAARLAGWQSRGRWDRYVEGDDAALTGAEREGVATFISVGCVACHRGRNLGGASMHKLGAVLPFASADPGREAASGHRSDRDMWRAPMLRHAAATAPYLHDGSIAGLDDAVRVMGVHELGKQLEPPQVRAIVAMLRAAADIDLPPPRSEH